jgi:lysophospholipase L1-like esterase
MAVLDSDNNVVRYINGQSAGTYTINLPTEVVGGTVLINLFNYKTVPNPHYDNIDVVNYVPVSEAYRHKIKDIAVQSTYKTTVKKPFAFSGKTAVFTGDSITYGFTSGSTTVHGTGDYPTLFCAKVGMTNNNIAQGGACFCSGYNAVKTIPKQVEDVVGSIFDYLFIAGGVNDWQAGATLAEFIQTVEDLCTYINTNFPNNLPVIWITPINQAGWETTHALHPDAELQAFRDSLTKTVLKNDTYARFSVIQGTDFNFPAYGDDSTYISAMFGDLLHPTELGYKTLYVSGLLNALC